MGYRPLGLPNLIYDPSEYDGPRMGKLRLGQFDLDNRATFVYERIHEPRFDQRKTFLAVSLDGIKGRLIDLIDADLGYEPTDFNHDRFQGILRAGSLHQWWVQSDYPETARWLYTDQQGNFLAWELSRMTDMIPWYEPESS
jgi:hypothetical protein